MQLTNNENERNSLTVKKLIDTGYLKTDTFNQTNTETYSYM